MSVTTWFYNVILLSACAFAHNSSKTLINTETCALLYEKGIEAYLENDFKGCVNKFEAAIEKYRQYSSALQNCRIMCKHEAQEQRLLYPDDVEDLHFYERAIRTTLCILKCRQDHKHLFGEYNINPETEALFETRKPYEYLQICYFQIGQYQKCASAAFTFLVSNPDDKVMLGNLKYYSELPDVEPNDIINYEAKDFVYLYVHGSDAYSRKDWKAVEHNMEESLVSYLHAEEECRANCEGPFDQGWYPDFIPSIANHFTYCLRCKRKCKDRLSSLNGDKYEDLFPSHYHYLQFAYFKLGNIKKACRAVASYLLFYPNDQTMLENMAYYKKLPDVDDSFFTAREEAVQYSRRETYENRLYKFILKDFKVETDIPKTTDVKGKSIEVIKTAADLNGTQRYLADNFLIQEECKSLIYLAKLFALPGDGYIGNKTPHTVMETFEGVTLSRTSLLTYVGMLKAKNLKLILRVTEDAREHIETHFGLDKLYFTYTQLVCRSPIAGAPRNRTDFSHVVHADNCNLKKDLNCEKAYPSYTYRDYSAIIYLNDDFDGGEFVFVSDFYGEHLQSSVTPKCGRMVAFSSGNENLHAVKAVTKGSRCALGIWFTFDEKHAENRNFAYRVLEQV